VKGYNIVNENRKALISTYSNVHEIFNILWSNSIWNNRSEIGYCKAHNVLWNMDHIDSCILMKDYESVIIEWRAKFLRREDLYWDRDKMTTEINALKCAINELTKNTIWRKHKQETQNKEDKTS
jgi:hypothetical protein